MNLIVNCAKGRRCLIQARADMEEPAPGVRGGLLPSRKGTEEIWGSHRAAIENT